jgi:hypothetical protein
VLEFIVGLGLLGLSLTSTFLLFIWGPSGVSFAILLLLSGIFDMSIGYGFLEGKGWSWWIGIALNLLGLILGIASVFETPIFIATIVKSLVVLSYLSRSNVRTFFEISDI